MAQALGPAVAVLQRRADEHLVSLNRLDERTLRVEDRVSKLELTQAKAIGLLIGVSFGGSALGTALVKVLGG